ncbi:Cobyric acid synthase [Thalassocella blandensis]|nr:Cobyric acid synthase [Thalassocella blandensis]
MKASRTLMVQGTTSDAGKTTLVAALCRVLYQQCGSVAPFKPQNMALNSAVTEDGGEIGRAQALQAMACKLPAHTDMNPILIKPTSDVGAQIIVHGRALKNMKAQDYHRYKPEAKKAVLASYDRLRQKYEWIVVEGAGSPAEINLREGDIANMGFAEAVDCPVILIADIDRGGVFAHIVGTLDLLSKSERARVIGVVINRFRGDIALLQSGLDWLEERTGLPVLAVLPYLHNLSLDAEDAISKISLPKQAQRLRVVVPVLPRISNHTDFDALRIHAHVELIFANIDEPMPPCDLLILPGSKNVNEDLATLKQHGWPKAIARHLRYGGKLVGICGGYQMLGLEISDPEAIESHIASSEGLGLIPVKTVLQPQKVLKNVQGELRLSPQSIAANFSGYEIHCGISQFVGTRQQAHLPIALASASQHIHTSAQCDSYVSEDGQIFGSYIHGLFDSAQACEQLLRWAGLAVDNDEMQTKDLHHHREGELNRLVSALEQAMDLSRLEQLVESFYLQRESRSDFS